jgi:site-specific DNA-adenine methylase
MDGGGRHYIHLTLKKVFVLQDQLKEEKTCDRKAVGRCRVLLSNSDTLFIRELYSDFSIKEVSVQRAINCKGSKRAGHKELFISVNNTKPSVPIYQHRP